MTAAPSPLTTIQETIRSYWGYDQLRPLQLEAIEAELDRKDSLVVMPTGGGKSLCYAVPPIVANRTDIVVSPLIALMKDQVDALEACGYPAAAIHSGLTDEDRRTIEAGITAGKYRLLFVAPERLLTPWFLSLVKRVNVRSFAIDEAHCISHWGHDFRPEYRRLATLKQYFPEASLHAYTATATDRVRQDIIDQLGLRDPRVLIGRFDRPNLVYHILSRTDLEGQVLSTISRHKGEAVIVYCISRKDTEQLSAALQAKGVKASAYHAGLDSRVRTRVQEDFAAERVDVVVATVAFGMGIDRSNVRCVIHAAMPKSVEQYQQETGRAGRDGLPAECVLLFGAGDARRWESLMSRPDVQTEQAPEIVAAQVELLRDMERFGVSQECRHKTLSRYFGQEYDTENCGACDVCLTPASHLDNGTEVVRSILSCILSLGAPYGVGHVVDVLRGANVERIRQLRHNTSKSYGALKTLAPELVRSAVFQLVEQGLLARTPGDRPVINLTPKGRDALLKGTDVTLVVPNNLATAKPDMETASWENVDIPLFERLRELRRTIADERGVAAFVVFGDATLRELARVRPSTLAAFGKIRGVGERKLVDLGAPFMAVIIAYCKEAGLSQDQPALTLAAMPYTPKTVSMTESKQLAYEMFGQGRSLQEVVQRSGRSIGTIVGYLEEYVGDHKSESVAAWVSAESYIRVKTAALKVGGQYLKPVFEELNGEISYEEIRIVMRHAGIR